MSYAAWNTQGTQLKISITSTQTLIPGVDTFDISGGQKKTVEVTALDDTASKFVAGLADFGTLNCTMFWDPANTVHQRILTQYNTPNSSDSFEVVCADAGAATIDFSAVINGFEFPFGKDAGAQVKWTAKLSGPITVTP
jgi:hypothetical protein